MGECDLQLSNDGAIARLIGSFIIELNEEQHLTRRYISYMSLTEVAKPESADRLLEKPEAG